MNEMQRRKRRNETRMKEKEMERIKREEEKSNFDCFVNYCYYYYRKLIRTWKCHQWSSSLPSSLKSLSPCFIIRLFNVSLFFFSSLYFFLFLFSISLHLSLFPSLFSFLFFSFSSLFLPFFFLKFILFFFSYLLFLINKKKSIKWRPTSWASHPLPPITSLLPTSKTSF